MAKEKILIKLSFKDIKDIVIKYYNLQADKTILSINKYEQISDKAKFTLTSSRVTQKNIDDYNTALSNCEKIVEETKKLLQK